MPKRRSYDEVPSCAMVATLNLINGRWKGVVLYYLTVNGTMRFNELHRQLPGCTPRLLTKQLRELEDDCFITRTVYAVVPPKVEYALTEEGRSIAPILMLLNDWGVGWLQRRGLRPRSNEPV